MAQFDSGKNNVTSSVTDVSLLFVCTGNLCRSPLAEIYLRHLVGNQALLHISSAGTHADHGNQLPREGTRLLAENGVLIVREHSSQQVTSSLIAQSDLVLAMTLEQRQIVIETVPSSLRKAFTLREFSRIYDAMMADDQHPIHSASEPRFQEIIAWVSNYRGVAGANPNSADDEVVDPYRKSIKIWQQSLDQMKPSLDTLGALLTHTAVTA